VLKTGCHWSALPHDFSKYKTVHSYFMRWSWHTWVGGTRQPSVLEQSLNNSVGEARWSNGRSEKTSIVIVDAQSVENTDSAREEGYDAGKKVSGIKRQRARLRGGSLYGSTGAPVIATPHQK
jgi:hypothetical protein